MSNYRVLATEELKNMPNPALAKDMLERLVQYTAKVMERNKLKVGILSEFYPKSGSLLGLNVNRGHQIKIRLRESYDSRAFLPWPSILGTMIHELTHNLVGSHSAEFYEKMEKLHDEVDIDSISMQGTYQSSSSSSSSWTGKKTYGFDGPFQTLGRSSNASSLSSAEARDLAAALALSRQTVKTNRPIGSRKGVVDRTMGSRGKTARNGLNDAEYCLTALEVRARARATAQQAVTGSDALPSSRSVQHTDGCSVVTSPLRASETLTSDSCDPTAMRPAVSWQCQICTESNIAADGICRWCGCEYGSTLFNAEQRLQHGDFEKKSPTPPAPQRSYRKRTAHNAQHVVGVIDLTEPTAIEEASNNCTDIAESPARKKNSSSPSVMGVGARDILARGVSTAVTAMTGAAAAAAQVPRYMQNPPEWSLGSLGSSSENSVNYIDLSGSSSRVGPSNDPQLVEVAPAVTGIVVDLTDDQDHGFVTDWPMVSTHHHHHGKQPS